MKTNRPSVFQVIRADSTSETIAWVPLITIILLYFSEMLDFTNLLWISTGISILSAVGLFFRYRKIGSIFEDNIEVSATVTEVYVPPRGAFTSRHVDFTYEFQGEKYQLRDSVSESNKQVKSLVVGQVVTVVLDRNNPKHALIKELFLGEK